MQKTLRRQDWLAWTTSGRPARSAVEQQHERSADEIDV